MNDTRPSIWIVIHTDYDPPDIEAIYDNEEAAWNHCEHANRESNTSPYDIHEWKLNNEYKGAA